jgi:hypothetical protein
MVRRLLYLGVLVAVLCAAACGDTKPSTGGKKVEDPDANPVPKPGGVKAG